MVIFSVFKIREHGIQMRENLKIYDTRPKCDSIGSSFVSVRLNDCYAVVLAFAYGVIASISIMICEIIWKNKGKIIRMRARISE